MKITGGYPYFLQELGYAVWTIAAGPEITLEEIEMAVPSYEAKLDESFFRVRLDRATELQRAYLRAMAQLGPDPQKASGITTFAGSMTFVYIHAVAFAVWMLAFERSPWPTLTLIVSLEAIFLSMFVLIGQNRQAAFQQAKADHDFVESELELKTNTELTRQIHALTTELHRRLLTEGGG